MSNLKRRTVYLCHRHGDNAELIMKQIPLEDMKADDRESAMKEVKILDKLNHPNIIALYDSFIHGSSLCIVMEYAEGGTLLDYIQKLKAKGKTMNEKKILHLFSQIAESLRFIHSERILHRDMKTSNIFLNKTFDVVKVGDFGISIILDTNKSKAFSIIGTPSYISPELCENQPYNKKSDIWALGCILYEMITLKRAFEALNLPALVKKILTAAVPPVTGKYSDDLKELVTSLLNRDPEQRPTIKEVLANPLLINTHMDLPLNVGRPKGIRVPAPSVGVSSIVPGRPRPGKASLTSLSSYLEAEVFKHELPAVVYRWGGGVLNPTTLPLPGKSDVEVTQVAIGRTNKTGVTSKGRLIVWETSVCRDEAPSAAHKEDGKDSISTIPRFIDGHTGVSISHVSCGDMFNACLTDSGILMTFGNGANGCLGHGNLIDVKEPKIVEKLIGKQVMKVSCGAMHVMAVTADHSVFSWGKGDSGRLGHSNNEMVNRPEAVALPENVEALSCFCGTDCSVVLTRQNTVLACGGNRFNKLALNTNNDTEIDEVDHLVPVQMQPLIEVAFGVSHSAFLTEKGKVYACGSNSFGQLGLSKLNVSDSNPRLVKSLEEKNVSHIACGDAFTVAVTADNEIYTWGKGARGRLGTGSEDNTHEPTLVKFQEKLRVISISSNRGTTVAVTKEALS
ncbi:serine/threonine-protein kinase Nek8-like isoform X2 [Dendronephthya gigantea]|uniref:serine/threonine-protein kinase Nek8-like isoform X2 n=1 Tax=Dendronephthya gigantea TaxID=151771 RepID=UPI00106D8513|nr:serine/threonine-protein kinase Nek8-like isoform X2 [Dendronephthya gigantea]